MNLLELPLPSLPARSPTSHKGDFGRALLIGGSRGMCGAISLAGTATLRGGAGLVTLATPDVCLDVVAALEPAYMTLPLPSDFAGRIGHFALAWQRIAGRLAQTTAMAIGPGLGRSPTIDELVRTVFRDSPCPVVSDADALNALARQPEVLSQHAGPRILTPHPGEFRRLAAALSIAMPPNATRHDEELAAHAFAARTGTVVLLKGHQSLITDGQRAIRNGTGNPGLATGGSGDVLTGVLTALLCQGLAPWDAARLAAHVHGLAGDLAAADLGEASLIASDLARYLPGAMGKLS